MKKISLFLIVTLLLCATLSAQNQELICNNTKSIIAAGSCLPCEIKTSNKPAIVRLYVHLIADANGQNCESQEVVDNALRNAENYFKEHNIFFNYCKPYDIISSSHLFNLPEVNYDFGTGNVLCQLRADNEYEGDSGTKSSIFCNGLNIYIWNAQTPGEVKAGAFSIGSKSVVVGKNKSINQNRQLSINQNIKLLDSLNRYLRTINETNSEYTTAVAAKNNAIQQLSTATNQAKSKIV